MKLRRLLAWGGAAVGLALVVAAYLRPAVAFTLANQRWSCF